MNILMNKMLAVALVDTICNNLFEYNRDVYAEEDFDSSCKLIYHPPPLDEVWSDE